MASHPRVAVFHPGTQRGPRTAQCLAQEGLLAWYATGVYFDPARPPLWFRLLPSAHRRRVAGEFLRRHCPGLDMSYVRSLGSWEWAVIAAQRLGVSPRTLSRLFLRRNRVLGQRIGPWLNTDVDMLYSYNVALWAFREARRRGVLCIMDQTIATARTTREILLQESALCPPEWRPATLLDALWKGRHPDLDHATYEEAELAELSEADLVICGSEFCAESVRAATTTKRSVKVLPYGTDVTAFRPSTSAQQTSDFTVLFAGIISPRKGIRYLLEAVRSLSIPGLRIRLVGQKEVADAALAPYEDFITHVAHVPRPMMPEQYHQADLYVLPTLCEGSSNTIYEAMASGLPVITTPNAGSVIRDGQDGYIVPIRSAEAIAQRIEQLYIDRELAAAMGARGRARALQFTWEAYGRHLGQCLRGLWEETVRAASNQASPPGPPEPIRVPSPEVPA